MNYRECRLYSPTFLAYPHVCTLFKTAVGHNTVVGLVLMHLLTVIILNKQDPDIFTVFCDYTTPDHDLTFTVPLPISTSSFGFVRIIYCHLQERRTNCSEPGLSLRRVCKIFMTIETCLNPTFFFFTTQYFILMYIFEWRYS